MAFEGGCVIPFERAVSRIARSYLTLKAHESGAGAVTFLQAYTFVPFEQRAFAFTSCDRPCRRSRT